MRKVQKIVFSTLTVILISFIASYGDVFTAVKTFGNWADPTTWDRNSVPANGCIVIIPANITVEVSSNMYPAVSKLPTMDIKIYGTLLLYTGQLNLSCGSSICVYDNGMIYGNDNNSSQLMFGGGIADWKGMFDGTLQQKCITGDCFVLSMEIENASFYQMENKISQNFTVYPNPIEQGQAFSWKLNNENTEVIKLVCTNLQGQILFTKLPGELFNQEDGLPSGNYLILVYTNSEVYKEKIWVR